jgi:hypothetical protein
MISITRKRALGTVGVLAACFLSFTVAVSATPPPRTITVTKTVRVPVTKVVTRTVYRTIKVPVYRTVVKTVVVQPTAAPTPAGPQTLIDIKGSSAKQSDTFTASRPFTITWNAHESAGNSSMDFSIELDSASGGQLDLLANTSAPTQDSSVVHDDCSGGCYLKIDSLFADWHVLVSQ